MHQVAQDRAMWRQMCWAQTPRPREEKKALNWIGKIETKEYPPPKKKGKKTTQKRSFTCIHENIAFLSVRDVGVANTAELASCMTNRDDWASKRAAQLSPP